MYKNNNPEIASINNDQSIEFQKLIDLNRQINEKIEPYRANNFELSDIEFVKKNCHAQDAAFFSSANLHFSLKTMQHSSIELHTAVTILKKVFHY